MIFVRADNKLSYSGLMEASRNTSRDAGYLKLDFSLRDVKQDDSTMKWQRQAVASKSTIFWMALSARW